MNTSSTTKLSLLMQLRDLDNQEAWQQFVDQYGPMVYNWCRYWNLQQADAEDVTQALIVKLFQKIREFDYDRDLGSFRGWLKTVTHNAVRDFCRSRRDVSVDDSVWNSIGQIPAQSDFVERIERAFDLELLDQAKQAVKERVAPHTWRAFELCETSDLTVDQIAEQTGMQVATFYVAKSKVIKMLQEELAKLESVEH